MPQRGGSGFVAGRLRRAVGRGVGTDRVSRRGRAALPAPGGSRDRSGEQDPRIRAPRPGSRYRRRQPGARLARRPTRVHLGRRNPALPRPAPGAAADQQPAQQRRAGATRDSGRRASAAGRPAKFGEPALPAHQSRSHGTLARPLSSVPAISVWLPKPRSVELRHEAVPDVGPNDVRVAAIASAISHGTEMLVYRGQVPDGLALDRPTLRGSFAFPIKYGYASVGRVADVGESVSGLRRGDTVFSLHPHQSAYVVAETFPARLPQTIEPELGVF